jgi:hypothetical protein
LLQSLQERREAGLAYRMVFGERHKYTNAPDLRRLLRARAASGHAATTPPNIAMNSRRRMGSIRAS